MILTNYDETEEYIIPFFLLIVTQNVVTEAYLNTLPVKYLLSTTRFSMLE